MVLVRITPFRIALCHKYGGSVFSSVYYRFSTVYQLLLASVKTCSGVSLICCQDRPSLPLLIVSSLYPKRRGGVKPERPTVFSIGIARSHYGILRLVAS